MVRNPTLLLSPGVGHSSPEREALIDTYLTERLDLSPSALKRIKKNMGTRSTSQRHLFFATSVDKVKKVVEFFFQILEEAGTSEKAAATIITKFLTKQPSLFTLSVEENLQPRVNFLQNSCDLSQEDFAKFLSSGSASSVLCLSVSENLRPTVEFISKLMPGNSSDFSSVSNNDDVDEEEDYTENKHHIRKCVLSHPQILCLSLDNLQQKVQYFDAIDSHHQQQRQISTSLATRIAVRSPTVFSLSLRDNIIPTIEFLDRFWGTNGAPEVEWIGEEMIIHAAPMHRRARTRRGLSLSALLGEYPSILTLSLEGNIKPSISFFNMTGYCHLDEDWKFLDPSVDAEVIQKQNENAPTEIPAQKTIRGRHIACSLYSRLLPRWNYFKVHVLKEQDVKKFEGKKQPPLHILAVADDKSFCAELGVHLEDYNIFKEETGPALKFSTQFDLWIKTGRPIDDV